MRLPVVLLVLSFLVAGLADSPCAFTQEVAWGGSDSASSLPLSGVVEGGNRFAAELYAHLRSQTPDNLFFSPQSIHTALAMAYAGAAGATRQQMADVLHFEAPETALHPAMARLRALLVGDSGKGYQLRIANRLWGQAGCEFRPEFLQTLERSYGAGLATVDFAKQTEQARLQINGWVERQTENRIKNLIAPGVLTPNTRLVLTNAIYFKGDWERKFPEAATRNSPFYLASGQQVVVRMMEQTGHFRYGAEEDLQILELPYVQGKLSMLILLPRRVEGLPDLEKKLTEEQLRRWVRGMQKQKVQVYLPRFKITAQFQLADALRAMGMPLAFGRGADFSAMSPEKLGLSDVVHKAFVEVNEEGTEAAAATGSTIALPAPPVLEKLVIFRADHPYGFVIRDNRTGSLLFMGRVVNPAE